MIPSRPLHQDVRTHRKRARRGHRQRQSHSPSPPTEGRAHKPPSGSRPGSPVARRALAPWSQSGQDGTGRYRPEVGGRPCRPGSQAQTRRQRSKGAPGAGAPRRAPGRLRRSTVLVKAQVKPNRRTFSRGALRTSARFLAPSSPQVAGGRAGERARPGLIARTRGGPAGTGHERQKRPRMPSSSRCGPEEGVMTRSVLWVASRSGLAQAAAVSSGCRGRQLCRSRRPNSPVMVLRLLRSARLPPRTVAWCWS